MRCTLALPKTLESGFADIAENQPEILARHFTEAGLIEKAAAPLGKGGTAFAERSAMVEAVVQFTARTRSDRYLARHTGGAASRSNFKLRY